MKLQQEVINKEDKKEVLREINKLVPLFNKKIRNGNSKHDLILNLKKIRADYLKNYGVDIMDFIKICFNPDLTLRCLIFSINQKEENGKRFDKTI